MLGVDLVRTWGYPRELQLAEVVCGHWFEWGERCVFWTVAAEYQQGVVPGWATVHVRVVPGSYGLRYARTWSQKLEVIGDLLGYQGFMVTALLEPRLARVLAWCGWTWDSGWWYLSLAGEGPFDGGRRGRSELEEAAT